MAILKDFIDADHAATQRPYKAIRNRAVVMQRARTIEVGGRGTSVRHLEPRDAARYLIGAFATFVPARQAPEEVEAFAAMALSKKSRAVLEDDPIWRLEDGKVPKAFGTFGDSLTWLLELLADLERLNASDWNAIADTYDEGVITFRKSLDTRDAAITLTSKGGERLDIQYHDDLPDEYSVACPVWEAVTVPFHVIEVFGALLRGDADDQSKSKTQTFEYQDGEAKAGGTR